eukprot:Nk52_evm2s403 gene=Nk52_evmTU2s403
MVKKGGKKKASGAPMTEEEKILFMEQQMLKQEEMKKRKEEMMTMILKEKLAIEQKNTRINNTKLTNYWRNVMRKSKSEDIKKEIEVLSQTFEREVDRKDSIIKSLAKDIEEAEEQYENSFRSHLQNVDNLIDLYRARGSMLEGEFEEQLQNLKTEFQTESEMLNEKHRKETENVLDIAFIMEHEYNEQESDAKQEFQSLTDDVKNKNLEEKHALRIQLEGIVEDLWRQFQSGLNNYNANAEERKQGFEMLKAKDQRSAKTIEQQMRKLQRLHESVIQVKVKMANNARECEERNKGLKEEKEAIGHHFQELKSRMNRFREGESKRLTELTLTCTKVIKELTRKKEKAEKILKLAEMNRQLETEEEKVMPFYESSVTKEEEVDMVREFDENVANALAEEYQVGKVFHPPTDNDSSIVISKEGKQVEEYTSLDRFWKRYNKVLLDKVALDKERNALFEENANLKLLLKQYLDGISVNAEVMKQSNPLLVVNGNTNVPLNVPLSDGRVAGTTAVDGIEKVRICVKQGQPL